jgi:hypothetical protein
MKLQYPTYVKDIHPNVHIRVFKQAIKTNGEMVEVDIINLFCFILMDSIFECGKNYVQNHQNCTFKKLEQAFCKQFRTMKNEEVTCNCGTYNNKSPNMVKFIMNTY